MANDDDGYVDYASQILAQEIDKEVMESISGAILVGKGWTKTFQKLTSLDNQTVAEAAWIHLNATGDYKLLGSRWYFEKSSDATAFTLKWA